MAKRKQAVSISQETDLSDHPDDGGKLSAGPGRESYKLAAFWKSQVNAYDEATRRWVKRANTVVKRYRDERNRIDEEGQRRMNYLWANTQVMMPAIYSKCPIPIVDRKFLDRDPNGRLSSQMLERSLKNELDSNGFHTGMSRAVLDKLLAGRGTLWCRYVPEFGEGDSLPSATINGVEDALYGIGEQEDDTTLTGETEQTEKLEQTQEQVISEKTEVDYIDWRDFYYFPVKARTWAEVQAIGKKVYISKKEAKEFFGEKIGKSLKPDTTPMGSGSKENVNYSDTAVFQDINERSIVIFEIWNKSDGRVYWISTGYEYLCKVENDPLELTGFFPVPPPLFSTTTNDTLIPVPDYIEWQDQAIQIDELTQRIAMLSKACKVAGVYKSAENSIKRLFDESVENELIPVDQWAVFAEQGGLKGAIDFIPIDQVQSCLETLQKVRQQAQIDLDQVTGLSDVIRGTSDSRETLGGLRLKNNNAGTRLSKSQEEVARFARDVIVILAEIISKHFSDETIIESSGILYDQALQPDTILREWEAENNSGAQAAVSPLAPKPMQMPPGDVQAPMAPPMAPQIGSQLEAPVGGGMPPQIPNVIPFPGGANPLQPGMGMGGGPQSPMQGAAPPPMMPMMPPQPDPQVIIMQKIEAALELLRKDVKRGYRIDIETDSTIFGDKFQERQDATEFVTALGAYLKQFGEIAPAEPALLPLLGKTLQWAVRKYRTGRDLESEIDNFVIEMTQKAKDLKKNPPPSPEMAKANADIEAKKVESQMQQDNDARDHARMERDDNRQFQMEQAKDQREKEKMQMEQELERERMAMEREKMQMEMEFKREEHAMKLKQLQIGAQVDIHSANVEAEMKDKELDQKQQENELDNEQREKEHELKTKEFKQKTEQQNQAHKQKMQQQAQSHKDKMKPKPKKKAS